MCQPGTNLVGQASEDLQLLPDGPLPVHAGVVQVEDGVEGAVVERGQGVGREATHQEVNGVVDNLELNLKLAVVGLLEGEKHAVEQRRVVAEARALGQVLNLHLEEIEAQGGVTWVRDGRCDVG